MRAVAQRVSSAQVTVEGNVVGKITHGLLVLVGATHDDTVMDARAVAAKIAGLRVLADQDGKMNLSLVDTGGEALVVSQFTLYGDIRKGRRPSFVKAARPGPAQALVDEVTAELRRKGVSVATGRFGAMMEVSLVNDGPVTIILETKEGRFI
jgi:D-tyrosyl-tRNA(Tyr) deacylase